MGLKSRVWNQRIQHWWRVLSMLPTAPGSCRVLFPPYPHWGNAEKMLQLFQYYLSCEQHICWPHFASRLLGVAGDSSLTFTQVGCTSIQSPGMQSMLHFPPWRCFWFLSSCLSLFSPSSVIQLILSLTGFHFLYKYIAFSLASWLWKGFNTLLSPHLLFFVTIKGYSFFSRSLE